jgi:hypothetical protein
MVLVAWYYICGRLGRGNYESGSSGQNVVLAAQVKWRAGIGSATRLQNQVIEPPPVCLFSLANIIFTFVSAAASHRWRAVTPALTALAGTGI